MLRNLILKVDKDVSKVGVSDIVVIGLYFLSAKSLSSKMQSCLCKSYHDVSVSNHYHHQQCDWLENLTTVTIPSPFISINFSVDSKSDSRRVAPTQVRIFTVLYMSRCAKIKDQVKIEYNVTKRPHYAVFVSDVYQ